MGKLIRMSPAVLLMLTACGSRGTHDEEPGSISPDPACESDADCGDGAMCFEGTCVLLGETDAPDTPPPGTTSSETAPTTSSSTTDATTGPPEVDDGPHPSLTGVWIGYVEGTSFPSGSDAIRLVINADDCSPTGTMTLGEGDPLPPVTDPDVGYPDGFGLEFPGSRWYEGTAYTATGIDISDLRLQLDVNFGEVWNDWCELQEPIERYDGYYSCVDANAWSFDGEVCLIQTPEGDIPHDCGHLALCAYGACSCDESGCEGAPGGGASLDVAIDDGHLEGSLSGFGPVRFYREE
jgi:hypothetical protein